MGNHDSGDNGREYDYLFGADARVYRFHYGDSVFVVLDNGSVGVRLPWSEQLALAEKWLAEPPKAREPWPRQMSPRAKTAVERSGSSGARIH